jgi:hypothetical protein
MLITEVETLLELQYRTRVERIRLPNLVNFNGTCYPPPFLSLVTFSAIHKIII